MVSMLITVLAMLGGMARDVAPQERHPHAAAAASLRRLTVAHTVAESRMDARACCLDSKPESAMHTRD
jgi:hypothetical protein